jgi:hypothetical protein
MSTMVAIHHCASAADAGADALGVMTSYVKEQLSLPHRLDDDLNSVSSKGTLAARQSHFMFMQSSVPRAPNTRYPFHISCNVSSLLCASSSSVLASSRSLWCFDHLAKES